MGFHVTSPEPSPHRSIPLRTPCEYKRTPASPFQDLRVFSFHKAELVTRLRGLYALLAGLAGDGSEQLALGLELYLHFGIW